MGGKKEGKKKEQIRILIADDHTVVREGLVSLVRRKSDMAVVAEATPEEIDASNVDAAFRRSFSSLELVYRNATIHYPTAIFYHDGKLHGSAMIMGNDSHCPIDNPPASKPRKLSGSRVNSTTKRAIP